MYILGISAYYHDSAAVLIKDGAVVCAIEEERLSRKKHDNSFPHRAIAYCLDAAGISIEDVSSVAYYEKPLKKFERILEMFVRTFPFSFLSFVQTLPELLSKKLSVEETIRKELSFSGEIFFSSHHLSHAAAAFYPSPFQEAAVLTIDGVGEYETTCLWSAREGKLEPLGSIHFPHSLGLWYSTFTAFLGFRVNDGEYKMMGMAGYGNPRYVDMIRKTIRIENDGSFRLDMKYFNFEHSSRMWSARMEALLGEPRASEDELADRHFDIAASVQVVFEEVYMRVLARLHEITGLESVCIGGGVALNALANGKIYAKTPFKHIYIMGASGDSGAALGAALCVWHELLRNAERNPISDLRLGKEADSSFIASRMESGDGSVTIVKYNEERLLDEVCDALVSGKVVGWVDGRSEFGPRALGARSILARPDSSEMKEKLNAVKRRESFRPFGGIILKERVREYLDIPADDDAFPFMNTCFPVRKGKERELETIVHVDGTCRVQTIDDRESTIFKLLSHFEKKTGTPCLVNTSFNVKGMPVVETAEEAFSVFLDSPIDLLAVGDYVITKT